MDSLPEALLLEILSHLPDSADVARCRVASKAFNTVFPFLRSINFACSMTWYASSSSRVPSYKSVFLNLVSTLKSVESVCIGHPCPLFALLNCRDYDGDDFYLADDEFVNKWVPKVSESLKSLSIFGINMNCQSNILPLISKYCHNLVNIKFRNASLSVENLNPMPKLESLTLVFTRLNDEELNKMNECFPNLQVLNLIDPSKVKDPVIRLLNLKSCHLDVRDAFISTVTVIAPNLITLKIKCGFVTAIHIEAPMLSHFHLFIDGFIDGDGGRLTCKKFENLKTLVLESHDLGPFLSKLPVIKTVESLTLLHLGGYGTEAGGSKISLVRVLIAFPNMSSLCVNANAWLELEGWEILDGGSRLKTLCAYLMLVDPQLTFSYAASVLDQCRSLSQVSFLIRDGVSCYVSESFKSKCMTCWPRFKWRWGIWSDYSQDFWITK